MEYSNSIALKENHEAYIQCSDSLRKILPTKPSATQDSRLSMSGRMIKRPFSEAEKSIKPYARYILEYALIAEYRKFQGKKIRGVYINPSDKEPLLWFGVLFVHEGLYQGAVFRFEVHFPPSFPDSECPRVVFNEGIYHPAVSPETGDLNVAAEFHQWRKSVNHVWQVLQYMKEVFTNVDTKSPLNIETAKLLQNDAPSFEEKARQCALSSQEMILSPTVYNDINFIHFKTFNEPLHLLELEQ